jgi:1,4-dihydroxy-2-naphthoate octaprenyltransferase
MVAVMEYILAARPWSFTAGIVPVVITTALLNYPFFSVGFLRAVSMTLCVQTGANLSNTYFDFINGVDTKQSDGDKSLVDRRVSERGVVALFVISYIAAFLIVLPDLMTANSFNLFAIFFSGIALAYFYTATPVGLKYQAMGDLTIFLCFGPLLMQGISVLLTKETNSSLYVYSIPTGLITENILHANNARDIKVDSSAGISTLATILGFEYSYILYVLFFLAAYISSMYVAFLYHFGCISVLLTLPITFNLCKIYRSGKMESLPEETAKMHSLFGLLTFLGIYFTKEGIIKFIS